MGPNPTAQLRFSATPSDIERVARQIVDLVHPQKVILFGSHAYGTPTADSDADLMVIVKTGERPLRVAARIAAAIDHPLPLDILVRTPTEIAHRLAARDSFITEVVSKGTVLYEAGDG